ncbi:putative transcription factor TFIIB [Medicago truncatula]|uniref:Putative transcription factor TFIIB n=1 Tax=Medicago truncatula TaxID=3880 RepID=G7I5Z4_MEDTR|nr:hypothetical protein MTR_1g023620 [Medicago truncatula]RHN77551.1 putative transcription factor TFIIB [Medicago truncatula]
MAEKQNNVLNKNYGVNQDDASLVCELISNDLHQRHLRNESSLSEVAKAVQAAQEATKELVEKSEEFDIRRSPISNAAAVIYIIIQLSDDKKPLKDISVAIGFSEVTIRNSYKDLYPPMFQR